MRRQEIIGRSDAYLQLIGLVLWLKGQEIEAAEQWHNLIKEMDSGEIVFSDMAGLKLKIRTKNILVFLVGEVLVIKGKGHVYLMVILDGNILDLTI
jgi:hypothetical protein